MTCEWCRVSITFLPAQTSNGHAHWRTRCWNEAAEEQVRRRQEAHEASLTMGRVVTGPKGRETSEETKDMAAPSQRTPREVVDFPPNTPVPVALQYGQGKTISNQHGERMMYSLTDGRVMFLDLAVAGQIESAGINVREAFTITRKTDSQKGSPSTWEVARLPGEQPNGTLVVPALAAAATNGAAATPKPGASATGATPAVPRRQPGRSLVEDANALVDDFAAVLEHTLNKYQGRIKPEEAKALLITAYIQRGRNAA
jgi:hypothetical protein